MNATVQRTLDVDSHEMISSERREEFFGHTELHDVLTNFGTSAR
jgi:hypothetical protein